MERTIWSPLRDACGQWPIEGNGSSGHLGVCLRCVVMYTERSLTWELYRCKAWPVLMNSVEKQKWWAKLNQFSFQDFCSFLKIAQIWHTAMQFGQGQVMEFKHGTTLLAWLYPFKWWKVLSGHSKIHTGFSHMHLERCSWYYLYFPWHMQQSEQVASVPFWWESITASELFASVQLHHRDNGP